MIDPHPFRALVAQWKGEAKHLRALEARGQAAALELAAEELGALIEENESETLSLVEAAAASGYSADHLGRLVRTGKIPNAGRPNAPKIRRRDLPVKPGGLPRTPSLMQDDGTSRGRIARRIANSKERAR